MVALIMAALAIGADEKDPLVELTKGGKVASLSSDYKGTPFGSLMPYALDGEGNPIIYISTLATHTKNLTKNPACSVMVTKVDEDDLFNSARVTFLGKMKKVTDKDEIEKTKKLFFARHKKAEELDQFHDFAFYKLDIEKIYYIGGFGDIQWVEPKDYKKGFKK